MNPDAPLIAGMATMPSRFPYVGDAVQSIAPQVDRLYLYVNDEGGDIPSIEYPTNVKVIKSGHHKGDLKDAGKFWGLQQHDEAFYLSCDDDLVYPPTYADDLWSQIVERDGRVACGYHGCVAPDGFVESYYDNQKYKVHWRRTLDQPMNVNILGTGVMGIYTPAVDIPLDIFRSEPMADLYVAEHFQETKVPCVVLPHPGGWIQKVEGADDAPQISNSDRMDIVQGQFVSRRKWTLFR